MIPLTKQSTLLDIFKQRAQEEPDKIIYTFLEDGESSEKHITYLQLYNKARNIACHLNIISPNKGERVILLYPSGLEFIISLFGCFLAGKIAIPVYPPRQNKSIDRINRIINDSEGNIILTKQDISKSKNFNNVQLLDSLIVLNTDTIAHQTDNIILPNIEPDDIAFLQYTSGSTDTPKGVVIKHKNLISNLLHIRSAFGLSEDSLVVGWLPFFHDMGLVGNILEPMYTGFRAVLISYLHFIQKPERWLKAIDKYKATISGGPNFAYELCCKYYENYKNDFPNLSSWKIAFNGAEPVNPLTLKRFGEIFANAGFQFSSFKPCYGMAEATLLVSSVKSNEQIAIEQLNLGEIQLEAHRNILGSSQVIDVVNCGKPIGIKIKILKDGVVVNDEQKLGELCISGESVTEGYWSKTKHDKYYFKDSLGDSYLKTGDLGFVKNNNVYILGRKKEIVIVNGANYYPTDIETCIKQHLQNNAIYECAVFSCNNFNDTEKLIAFVEVPVTHSTDIKTIHNEISSAVFNKFEIAPDDVVFLRRGAIPKTSSGKIKRLECKRMYKDKKFVSVKINPEKIQTVINKKESVIELTDTERKLLDIVKNILSIESLKVTDNLFTHGLTSLKINQLLSAIENRFNYTLDIESIYANPVIRKIATIISCSEKFTDEKIRTKEVKTYYNLSLIQEGIWFDQQLKENHTSYNIPVVCDLDKDTEYEHINNCLQEIVKENEILRASFHVIDNEPMQKFAKDIAFKTNIINIDESLDNEYGNWEYFVNEQIKTSFDLEVAPLLKATLLTGKTVRKLLIVAHHIIVDGTSLHMLFSELMNKLDLDENRPKIVNYQYSDYVEIEKANVEKFNVSEKFWVKRLSGIKEPTFLPYDHIDNTGNKGKSVYGALNKDLSHKLNEFCRCKKNSIHTLLLTALKVTLFNSTHKEEITVGNPVSGRIFPKSNEMLGVFINAILIRTKINPEESLLQLLERVNFEFIACMEHQTYPLHKIAQKVNIPRIQGKVGTSVFLNGLNIADFESGYSPFDFFRGYEDLMMNLDVNLYYYFASDGLKFRIDYRIDRYNDQTIKNFISTYFSFIEDILTNSNRSITDFIREGKKTDAVDLSDISKMALGQKVSLSGTDFLVSQFEKIAKNNDEEAVVYGDIRFTYNQLNGKANTIARQLKEAGVKENTLIPIMANKSVDFIISILGLLKLGAGYIPLDAALSQQRLDYILNDVSSDIIIADNANNDCIEHSNIKKLIVCADQTEISENFSDIKIKSDTPFYGIYTSGTTGRPKCAINVHLGIVNRFTYMNRIYKPTNDDVILFNSSHLFDASVWQMFWPLTNGAKVIVPDNSTGFDIYKVIDLIDNEKVTITDFVPSVFDIFVEYLENNITECLRIQTLKHLLIGGEALKPNIVRRFQVLCPLTRITNTYGPTEASIGTIFYFTEKGFAEDIPIGQPIDNVKAFILDNQGNLTPKGKIGELHLGGDCVGLGYLNAVEITSSVFKIHLINNTEERLYATGDLAYYGKDDNIYFVGRKDNQVKIKGIRIELGEIEFRLRKAENVKDCVVLLFQPDFLVAFLRTDNTIDVGGFKSYLSRYLAEYMIPGDYVRIEKFPVNQLGKVDRNKLKELWEDQRKFNKEIASSTNVIDKKLIEIFNSLLGVSVKNTDENFFELGVDSLKAIRLQTSVKDVFSVNVSLKDIFTNPTINKLADLIGRCTDKDVFEIKKVEKQEYYSLSHTQARLWILNQLEKNVSVYNITGLYEISGLFDLDIFQKSMDLIVSESDILRTTFHNIDGIPKQKLNNSKTLPIAFVDIVDNKEQRLQEEIKNSFEFEFNLVYFPLLNVKVIRTHDSCYKLIIAMHHIIGDAWSMEVLFNKIINTYRKFSLKKQQAKFTKPSIQYLDYVGFHNALLKDKKCLGQKKYWMKKLSGKLPDMQLPYDYLRPQIQGFNGDSVKIGLNAEKYELARKFCMAQNVSFFSFFFSVIKVLLYKYTNQKDQIVGIPIAGRNHLLIEDQIGCFINSLAIRSTIEPGNSFSEYLKLLNNELVDAYENSDYPLDKIVDDLKLDRDLSKTPLYQVMVTMFNSKLPEGKQMEVKVSENEILKVSRISPEIKKCEFDLVFNLIQQSDRLEVEILYNTALFKRIKIEGMMEHFNILLDRILSSPDHLIKNLDILAVQEKSKILSLSNNNPEQTQIKHYLEQFENNFLENPHSICLVDKENYLTYKDVHERSNQLANYLVRKGNLKQNDVIALLFEPSVECILSILAIHKAGCSYIPIDKELPVYRKKLLLQDTNVKLIISNLKMVQDSYTELSNHENSEVQIKETNTRKPILNIDELPIPDRSLLNYEKYCEYSGLSMAKYSLTMQATRGCPYSCSYCSKIFEKKYRVRSCQHLFEEVNLYYKMGVKRFSFIDDIFNLNKQFGIDFFKEIIKNKLDIKISFPAGLRGDVLTKEYIDLMIEAGVFSAALALETASERLQQAIKKDLKLDKLYENLEYISTKYPEVITELFTMHGFPTETEEEAYMTLDFIKSINWIHFPYVHLLKIYPNTDMEDFAIKSGISKDAIESSRKLAWHQIPQTIPFDERFTVLYQVDFLNNYFLDKERLRSVLPHQMNVLTEDEILQKYNNYLPTRSNSISELFNNLGIDQFDVKNECVLNDDIKWVDFNKKAKKHFNNREKSENPFKVLLIDATQSFSGEDSNNHYDPVEPPLGLLYLASYIHKQFKGEVECKIIKSKFDFDNYSELQTIVKENNPELIGIRSLTYYKNQFNIIADLIKLWLPKVIICAGGPYATSEIKSVLANSSIDFVVKGEGEVTFAKAIEKIINNRNSKNDTFKDFSQIDGIAYRANSIESYNDKRFILLYDLYNEVLRNEPTSLVEKNVCDLNNTAYLISTSGTTGKPKSILVNHRNLSNLVVGLSHEIFSMYDSNQNVALIANYVFDASVQQIFSSLSLGHKLHLVPANVKYSGKKLVAYYNKYGIDITDGTPSHLKLIGEVLPSNPTKHLQHMVIGGEKLTKEILEPIFNNSSPKLRISNIYGTAECTVDSSVFHVDRNNYQNFSYIPIGKSLPNQQLYVISDELNLLPIGFKGELYIGGECVSNGYLNHSDLTASKFIKNPYKEDDIIYKTGDLVRMDEDGVIHIIDRIDFQVKIRGMRIETEEITKLILKHRNIRDAITVCKTDDNGDPILISYYLAYKEFEFSKLWKFMVQYLPVYMVPTHFIYLHKWPLNNSGKIDRSLLPNPSVIKGSDISKPENTIQQQLLEIWGTVLKQNESNIDVNANFFGLGGNSLKANQVLMRVQDRFKVNLSLRTIFEYPTIVEISEQIEQNQPLLEQEEAIEVNRNLRNKYQIQ